MLKKVLAVFFLIMAFPALSHAGVVGKAAPGFTLNGLDGKAVELERFKGTVVFLDFWASWCPPCKKEMPEIARLAEKFSSSDLSIVAVSVDKKKEHAKAFISTVPGASSSLIVLHDPEASVVSAYSAQAMPTSFIIDRAGVIRFVHFGYREEDPVEWEKEIESLLKGR
ncbi:MAG: TlpA family protein disulfide reductase [Deltaproteobacteria bacterium]|nr:TlpA family protein disulfide reductase [Deltaproteobacteria bacterium]